MARECVEILESRKPGSRGILYAKRAHGIALFGAQRYPEAEEILLSAYHGMRRRTDPISPNQFSAVVDTLARLSEAQGDSDKAAEWRRQLLTTKP